MPLFGSHRRSSSSDENIPRDSHTKHRSTSSAFSRNRYSPPPAETHIDHSTPPARRRSFLARFREHPSRSLADDPSIKAAQEKVTDAEHAERDADQALAMAKRAVKAARLHVRELEAAALEEAKRARAKQREAKSIRRGADRLGRHDNH